MQGPIFAKGQCSEVLLGSVRIIGRDGEVCVKYFKHTHYIIDKSPSFDAIGTVILSEFSVLQCRV